MSRSIGAEGVDLGPRARAPVDVADARRGSTALTRAADRLGERGVDGVLVGALGPASSDLAQLLVELRRGEQVLGQTATEVVGADLLVGVGR